MLSQNGLEIWKEGKIVIDCYSCFARREQIITCNAMTGKLMHASKVATGGPQMILIGWPVGIGGGLRISANLLYNKYNTIYD